ncbi:MULTISPECIES: phage integrase central domain-containing protein [Xanthobacter]|uniref:phage integrase central domain-containing protein n=1 Tax=Xanthobacter TaxID=279 RepID=UPI0024AE11AB|nr:integrase arm-type DNA-binding domain-containing protein [Xanthobacter autotrophicus]
MYLFRWKGNPSQPGTGRLRELGLGSCKAVSLAEAREAAAEARKMVAAGVDPIAAKRAAARPERKVPTFAEVAEEHIKAMEPGWRNEKHVAQWRTSLSVERGEDGALTDSGYCTSIREKPVDEIDTAAVLAIITPLWQAKAETASRIRGRIEKILDVAKAKGLRSGESPARWRGHLELMLPARQRLQRGHHAAMP